MRKFEKNESKNTFISKTPLFESSYNISNDSLKLGFQNLTYFYYSKYVQEDNQLSCH